MRLAIHFVIVVGLLIDSCWPYTPRLNQPRRITFNKKIQPFVTQDSPIRPIADRIIQLGLCLVDCVASKVPGKCWEIFDCAWPCFTPMEPPASPVPATHKSSRRYFTLMMESYSSRTWLASTNTKPTGMSYESRDINVGNILRFFSCFGKCLFTNLPVNPFGLAGFLGCVLGFCICYDTGSNSGLGVRSMDTLGMRDFGQLKSGELAKNVRDTLEERLMYGYDTGLSF